MQRKEAERVRVVSSQTNQALESNLSEVVPNFGVRYSAILLSSSSPAKVRGSPREPRHPSSLPPPNPTPCGAFRSRNCLILRFRAPPRADAPPTRFATLRHSLRCSVRFFLFTSARCCYALRARARARRRAARLKLVLTRTARFPADLQARPASRHVAPRCRSGGAAARGAEQQRRRSSSGTACTLGGV